MANHNYVFRNIDEALPFLCRDILEADEVGSRNGRTKELTHVSITYTNPLEREITNPMRKHSAVAQIAETAWVLAGRDDVEWLEHYLPRAAEFSDNGKTWSGAYGRRLRHWRGRGKTNRNFDQLAHVVSILKNDALSRQAVMGVWDPGFDNRPGLKDRPCNDLIIFTNRLGYLDMHVTIRSNDLIWGHSGVNVYEWSVTQELVAQLLGVMVGKLHFSIGSLHIYDRHWNKALKMAEVPVVSSKDVARIGLELSEDTTLEDFDELLRLWFEVEEGVRLGLAGAGQDIENFPEPMLQSWLYILDTHWNGNDVPEELVGTRLLQSYNNGVVRESFKNESSLLQPMTGSDFSPVLDSPVFKEVDGKLKVTNWSEAMEADMWQQDFMAHAKKLHEEKNTAYGPSWQKRGEVLGILANIARKVDRLAGGKETTDETRADTALDLYIYAAMYRWWLVDQRGAQWPFNNVDMGFYSNFADHPVVPVNELMKRIFSLGGSDTTLPELEARILSSFTRIEKIVVQKDITGMSVLEADREVVFEVDALCNNALWLAYGLWLGTQNEYRGADAD